MKKTWRWSLTLALIALLFSSPSHGKGNVPLSPSQSDYPNANLLVSADSLQTSLGAENLVIIDARASGYESAHIPGAVNVKFGDYFTRGEGLLPTAELKSKLGAAGLTSKQTIVIYDNTTASFGAAGRIFWMLEYLGCKDAHLLDGGWDKWAADGRPTETTINTLPAVKFKGSVKAALKASKKSIAKKLKSEKLALIDSRTDEEYMGWQLYGEARGGHIPSAVQIPYAWLFNSDKTVLGYSSAKTMFESRGITPQKQVAAYCTVGIRSGFVYFMLRLMGYPKASNYDASIVEWSADESLPMEKAARFSEIVHPSWVKALIDYHASGSTAEAPAEYPYERDHKYLIFETQWGTIDEASAYKSGHIPGAVHSNSDTYENGYPRWFLLSDAELHNAMGGMGITEDTTVVVYSDSSIFAARLWWILKYAGVKDVRFLNGGYEKWLESGYEGETAINTATPATFSGAVHPEYIATTDYVYNQYAQSAAMYLGDVRSEDEYNGVASGYSYLEAKGRIPGAVWLYDADSASTVYNDGDGTLRSYSEVIDVWKNAGIGESSEAGAFDKEVIFYCGGGYRSALAFLYGYAAGYDNIRNYSDGWMGWSTTYTQDDSCGGATPGWCQEASGRPIE